MKELALLVVLTISFQYAFGQTEANFRPTVYAKQLPKNITVANQPADFKITTHLVNIKVPSDSAKNWSYAMEKRYIRRLFNFIKDVDCLILNYSGFYVLPQETVFTIKNGFSFEFNIQNSVENIGLKPFSNSADYNSEKLKQVITLSEDFALRPQVVTHEFFHQWNSFLESSNYWLMNPDHHTGLVEEANSVFYGHYIELKPVKDSIYTAKQGYCTGFPGKLEGYLAGIWDMPDELKTLKNYYFYDNLPRVWDPNERATTSQVKADSLVILKKERLFALFGGERIPNYKNSKKHFDGAVVVFSLDNFIGDDKLKGFHYASMLNEAEGTASDYNNLHDQIFDPQRAYSDTEYGMREVNPYHATFKNLHLHTQLFNEDGTNYAIPNCEGGINGSTSVCRSATNVVYSIPAIKNATSYIWTLPSGATGTSTTNSIAVNFGPSAVTGDITVKGHNATGDGNTTILRISVTDPNVLPATPPRIIGRQIVCAGQNSVFYTVPEVVNASSYAWTLPSGASGTSTTNSISVNYSNSSKSGEVTVKGINCYGEGALSILPIIVNAFPVIPEIIGSTTMCKGDTIIYSIPAVQGAASYFWDIDPSLFIGKMNTTSVKVYLNSKNLSSFGFSVKVYTGCGDVVTSPFKTITVKSVPLNANEIDGPSSICFEQNGAQYSVLGQINATSYIWTLPTGASGTSITNNITINYGASAVSGNITVKGHNECGDGLSSKLAVNVNPILNPPVITSNGKVLHSDAPTWNQWYNQNVLIPGATEQDYTITSVGEYSVRLKLNGCTSQPSNTIKDVVTSISSIENKETIKVYPNPVTDDLTLEAEGILKEIGFKLYNPAGQQIYNGKFIEKTIIHTSSFASGIYLILFDTGKAYDFKKIVKSK